MRIRDVAMAGGLGVAVLAACGGDDGTSPADFESEVEAICTDVTDELDRLGEPADFGELATFGEDATAIVEDAIAELEDIEAPEDVRDDFEAWLDIKRQQLGRYDDVIEAARDEDQAALDQVLADLDDLDIDGDDLAQEIGIDDCVTDDAGTPTDDTDVATTDATAALDVYGLSEGFAAPEGYTIVDADQETLDQLATEVGAVAGLAGLDELAAGNLVDADGALDAIVVVAFQEEGLAGTPAGQALLDWATAAYGGQPEAATTPAGREVQQWVDDDGDTSVLLSDGTVSVWLIVSTSADPTLDAAAQLDAFLDANAD